MCCVSLAHTVMVADNGRMIIGLLFSVALIGDSPAEQPVLPPPPAVVVVVPAGIPAPPQGSHDGVPLPIAPPVAVKVDTGDGIATTGPAEASAATRPIPEGYGERLDRQFCEAIPWQCVDGFDAEKRARLAAEGIDSDG
jgi:hypothetical protein